MNQIHLLAYNDCLASELFSFRDIMLFADRIAELRNAPRIQVSIVTANDQSIVCSGGARLEADRTEGQADYVIVPGFFLKRQADWVNREKQYQYEINYIRDAYQQGSTLASICVGAYLLASANLIPSAQITTAWYHADHLQSLYPSLKVHSGAMLAEDQRMMSSGAFSAGHDLALLLIERICGAEVARETRSLTLLEGIRKSQGAFVEQSLRVVRRGSFAEKVEEWLNPRIGELYSLDDLATHLNTSSRTVLRKYKAERGFSPLKYLQKRRVEKARILLEETLHSIECIAQQVGYQDLAAFRTLFSRETGLPPATYRRHHQR